VKHDTLIITEVGEAVRLASAPQHLKLDTMSLDNFILMTSCGIAALAQSLQGPCKILDLTGYAVSFLRRGTAQTRGGSTKRCSKFDVRVNTSPTPEPVFRTWLR
jgi:hypothetical protein